MDLKLFMLVGLCCVLRASANEMRDKGMQALKSGQLNRLHSRFGRNFPMSSDELTEDEERQMNEILNTLPDNLDNMGGFEPGMADNKWHLPLEKQLLKYLWSTKPRKA